MALKSEFSQKVGDQLPEKTPLTRQGSRTSRSFG